MKAKAKKNPAERQSNVAPDLSQIADILSFMEQHGLDEFEYQNSHLHIRLRKASSQSAHPFRTQHSAPEIFSAAPPAPHVAAPSAPAPAASAAPAPPESSADLHVIKSPIVGTFYSSPTPGAASFVRTGDRVQSGQVLCIIEAMKLMNEIESDVAGEVMRIFVENGQPVEYGEPLFAIHPSRKQ
ncbi:MAG TPA: acetyl-CoA carboxylase biotin carboxyl carrier protein [Candidatus Acidoferrales bacterium]|nr:acetyl-CoA carboxylase biotin carboxyl carrier protein [Candidatus Acidoferrales bacterium]